MFKKDFSTISLNFSGYKEIKASEELFDFSGAGCNEESLETTIGTTGTF